MTDELPRSLSPEVQARLLEVQETSADRSDANAQLGGNIIRWRDVDDVRSDIREVWMELSSWVSWLIWRYEYPISTIPDCWFMHGALVEELSALHSAWKVNFDDSDSGLGPVGFHERLFVANARLKTHYRGGCSDGHTDPHPRPASTYREEFKEWSGSPHSREN